MTVRRDARFMPIAACPSLFPCCTIDTTLPDLLMMGPPLIPRMVAKLRMVR